MYRPPGTSPRGDQVGQTMAADVTFCASRQTVAKSDRERRAKEEDHEVCDMGAIYRK
jgi:hypothetical protein